jgi:hypothetical protein
MAKKKGGKSEGEKDRTIGDAMAGDAAWAVHLLKKGWDLDLDYSEGSIEKIEETAGSLYEFVDEDRRDIDMYSEYMGAYIGEVFRRHVGGEWVWWEDKGGRVPSLKCGELTIFPHDKVRKRLTHGVRESLTAYYGVFKAQAGRK